MKGYQLVTCRIFCVKTELRRKGLAAALLSASITNAKKEGAEAFFFTAPNKASQELASKINVRKNDKKL
jgi:GNAT superfamily N-acetyltransferase